jgi:murein DD-endopeptidase MepM/ murein hydrolase activator NlpD
MERYSLILVSDETSPIRRFDLEKRLVRRSVIAAAALVAVLAVGLVDYVRVRIEHVELERLRVENAEQQARIDAFDEVVSGVESKLDRIGEFERKVRTIANLPGSAASGGADVVEVGDGQGGDLEANELDGALAPARSAVPAPRRASAASGEATDAERMSLLRREAERLGLVADSRALSLAELVDALEDKHQRLASSPAIWPTKGWLTSRFGMRISPFTGRRQFHAGVDIAGAPGTEVIAPARGRVVFAGKKGPLGKTIIIDHGYGIETHYGHNADLFVKKGDQVDRGQKIASIGNSGRSTGPHLHYTVEVHGKAVNPLDYIFD